MDFLLKSDIESSINRTRKLIDSKILWHNEDLIFKQSVLIEILINLKDLLIKCEKHLDKRICFTDDVIKDEVLKINDITDLISNFRDAACHNDSFRRKIGSNVSSFNVAVGKFSFQINDTRLSSDYSDDIAFNMGRNILFLKRHIERAFREIEEHFNFYISSQ